MSPLKRGCAHRKNILGNAVSFQVLGLLMAFSVREWMIKSVCNYSNILLVSSHTDVLQGFAGWKKFLMQSEYSLGCGQFGVLKYVFFK